MYVYGPTTVLEFPSMSEDQFQEDKSWIQGADNHVYCKADSRQGADLYAGGSWSAGVAPMTGCNQPHGDSKYWSFQKGDKCISCSEVQKEPKKYGLWDSNWCRCVLVHIFKGHRQQRIANLHMRSGVGKLTHTLALFAFTHGMRRLFYGNDGQGIWHQSFQAPQDKFNKKQAYCAIAALLCEADTITVPLRCDNPSESMCKNEDGNVCFSFDCSDAGKKCPNVGHMEPTRRLLRGNSSS
jgi:hypothetical protein